MGYFINVEKESLIILLCFVVALAITSIVYPVVLRFALQHRVMDKPAKRKLQHCPVPVMGGVAIAMGMLIPFVINALCFRWQVSLWWIMPVVAMLCIGLWDDMRNLSAAFRFCMEVLIVGVYVGTTGVMIDSLHGLWDVQTLSPGISIPLSVIAGVGIINSINMIDGVDGYSSGFCIVACALFAALFGAVGDYALCGFMCVGVGALVPFFLHNVFGKTSKMYIGDGGTLMFGTIMSGMVFVVLQHDSPAICLEERGMSLVAFCLAVLCVPVFDTVRVMCARIAHGVSPFQPDKTHLHHLFLDLGFSHIGTTLTLIITNLLIVLLWWICYLLGASMAVQLYVVIALGILTTFVWYAVVRHAIAHDTALYRCLARMGKRTQWNNSRAWTQMQRCIDRNKQCTI